MSDRQPAQTFPPSLFIQEEMQFRGWKAFELMQESDLTITEVYQLLHQDRQITPHLAGGLAKAFGVSAQLFLNLEKAYQESKKR